MDISERLSIEGPDGDGDFEISLDSDDYIYHYITKEQALKLAQFILEALK